mmetsp:Transcript_14558/g.35502  ORF Transcript_14558/g.35502 Transcript_14558/m.35502 type:complete len:164 (-) Transcript_14558:337-828(-)
MLRALVLLIVVAGASALQSRPQADELVAHGGAVQLVAPETEDLTRSPEVKTASNSTGLVETAKPVTADDVAEKKSPSLIYLIIWITVGVIAASFAIVAAMLCCFYKAPKVPAPFTNIKPGTLEGTADQSFDGPEKEDDPLRRGSWIHSKKPVVGRKPLKGPGV